MYRNNRTSTPNRRYRWITRFLEPEKPKGIGRIPSLGTRPRYKLECTVVTPQLPVEHRVLDGFRDMRDTDTLFGRQVGDGADKFEDRSCLRDESFVGSMTASFPHQCERYESAAIPVTRLV